MTVCEQLCSLPPDVTYVCADSAYSGEGNEGLLSLGGFASLIQETAARNDPLSDAAKELNRGGKSSIIYGLIAVTGRR
jgi:hypothetical protein